MLVSTDTDAAVLCWGANTDGMCANACHVSKQIRSVRFAMMIRRKAY
jgi:hypothetical protein